MLRFVLCVTLRYDVSVHDLCSLPLLGSFFRDLFRRSVAVELVHRVRCTFELMIREGIVSVPAWVAYC